MFILMLHTICQPYIKRAHNIIDALLFSNLILINFLLFFNYHKSRSQKPNFDAIRSSAIVQLMLVYLPLVVVGIYVLMCLLKKAANSMCVGGKSRTNGIRAISVNANKLRELLISTISRDENSRSNLYEEFIHERDTCNYNYF